VLSGDRDGDETPDVDDVVTASNLSNAVIDGFTVRHGGDAGIKCESSSLAVVNCKVTANYYGIEGAEESSLTVRNSMIRENYYEGIIFWERDAADEVVVENTCILGNGGGGIHCDYETGAAPVIRNSTVVGNGCYGGLIFWSGQAEVRSCIVWGNAWDQLWSCSATYSCIEGGWDGTGNIDADPLFIDEPEEAYDYHLSESSPCKDSGDGNYTPSDPEETDIDGEARVTGDGVDMGADEYYDSAADFDGDEVVNFLDHAVFASAWLSSAGEGGYNGSCDLVEDETIDYSDFAVFCEDWLWEAGWTKSFGEGRGESMAMGGEPGGRIASPAAEQVEAEQVKEVDIEELLKLLGEVWLDEEVRKVIGEEEWAAFVEAVKAALLQDG